MTSRTHRIIALSFFLLGGLALAGSLWSTHRVTTHTKLPLPTVVTGKDRAMSTAAAYALVDIMAVVRQDVPGSVTTFNTNRGTVPAIPGDTDPKEQSKLIYERLKMAIFNDKQFQDMAVKSWDIKPLQDRGYAVCAEILHIAQPPAHIVENAVLNTPRHSDKPLTIGYTQDLSLAPGFSKLVPDQKDNQLVVINNFLVNIPLAWYYLPVAKDIGGFHQLAVVADPAAVKAGHTVGKAITIQTYSDKQATLDTVAVKVIAGEKALRAALGQKNVVATRLKPIKVGYMSGYKFALTNDNKTSPTTTAYYLLDDGAHNYLVISTRVILPKDDATLVVFKQIMDGVHPKLKS